MAFSTKKIFFDLKLRYFKLFFPKTGLKNTNFSPKNYFLTQKIAKIRQKNEKFRFLQILSQIFEKIDPFSSISDHFQTKIPPVFVVFILIF